MVAEKVTAPAKQERSDEMVTIPRSAAICATRYFMAAFNSERVDRPVDGVQLCQDCSMVLDCFYSTDRSRTVLDMAQPLFDAAGFGPSIAVDGGRLPFVKYEDE